MPDRGWPAVASLGEVLFDFVARESDVPLEQVTAFHRAAGGAPANVAVGLARLDVASAFLGKVGGDAFGRSLRQMLADEGVDVRGVVVDPAARTPLAFVGSDGQGGRRFVFYHEGMADTLLRADEVHRELIAHAAIFHFGSVTLVAEPSRAATFEAARWAREAGCLVSFDPNVRLELWDSPRRTHASIQEALGLADLVKVSGDELDFLTGTTDPVSAARRLREAGPRLVVVTLGAEGCYYDAAESSGHVPGVAVQVVDSLGAGDAFVAGLLASLAGGATRVNGSRRPSAGAVDRLAPPALVEALRFANAVGGLATTTYGAIPALPSRAAVERLLEAEPDAGIRR